MSADHEMRWELKEQALAEALADGEKLEQQDACIEAATDAARGRSRDTDES